MTVSLYQISIPVFIRGLDNLAAILDKAAAHAAAHKIDPAVLLSSRLYPDMFPLSKQIQRAVTVAVGAAAGIAAAEAPKAVAEVGTFDDFTAAIGAAIEFLGGIARDSIDGAEARSITVVRRGESSQVEALPHLLGNVLPNFYFHFTTAYAILRHNGVDVGKQDFIGRP